MTFQSQTQIEISHYQFHLSSSKAHNFKKAQNMSLITINHTLVVTALLFAAVALLGVPMAEGLRQEKRGGLRRQLDDELSAVKLLTAGRFAILTKTGVTTTGSTSLKGDMGTSPITGAAITGFGLITDPSDTTFSTSSLVTGKVFASDYTSPTPNMLTVAVLDMQAAYVDAAGRPDPDYVELGAGNIEGLTLDPGLYKWGTNVGFTNIVTFNGTATDIWILQIDGDVTAGSGAEVTLSGGALAKNIFWQIAGKTDLGTTSHVEGVFLCSTAITFKTGSSMNGAALAQTAVTLDSATIVKESVCDVDVGCVAPN
jgi:hypothetical protein